MDRQEWMEDEGKSEGKLWESFSNRKPRMEYCDVKLRSGEVIGPCWPRTGDFVDLSDDDEQKIAFKDVSEVRYFEDAAEVTDEDEDDEED
jgi:hypothetical protein